MFLDAHIHLQDASEEENLRDILALSGSNNIGRFFCNSSTVKDWEAVSFLARRHGSIIPFFGLHPWYAADAFDGWRDRLKVLLEEHKAGVGEIGLDRFRVRRGVSMEKQIEVFEHQLDLALNMGLPFVAHCAGSWDEFMAVLRSRRLGSAAFILHSFSSGLEFSAELAGMGAYFSFSLRSVTQASDRTRKALCSLPRERILLETDFPYLSLNPGGREYGAAEYFSRVEGLYRAAAGIMGMEADELEKIVWENGRIFANGIFDWKREDNTD